ncbi:GIY-YIG catalytic domain-containing protein [Anaerocolumna jejuensis DSM 15929]|uniref:GIY-YIG catalytic domain-containing protein n=1 Tax=Anaerocolumna jejuensis DSM 15929 TaxID=1121322 RepID=A0A1M6WZN5_9FIRM|nr:GIY-YIG nuclease family protein [Anaerocolumna jejuensis]SHK99146.1 GIY-YIG catalytic domain-containing protein [Anaerocolumna jejuensis DSM 15929]
MNIPEYDGIGVYALIDKENGKRYIGSYKNVKKRIYQHIKSFENKKCSNKLLVAVEQEHKFDIEILERIPYGVNLLYV